VPRAGVAVAGGFVRPNWSLSASFASDRGRNGHSLGSPGAVTSKADKTPAPIPFGALAMLRGTNPDQTTQSSLCLINLARATLYDPIARCPRAPTGHRSRVHDAAENVRLASTARRVCAGMPREGAVQARANRTSRSSIAIRTPSAEPWRSGHRTSPQRVRFSRRSNWSIRLAGKRFRQSREDLLSRHNGSTRFGDPFPASPAIAHSNPKPSPERFAVIGRAVPQLALQIPSMRCLCSHLLSNFY